MGFQFINLQIEHMILHEIYKRNNDQSIKAPLCSNELTQLDAQGLNTLQQRIIDAIGNESYSIEMVINDVKDDSVFNITTKLLDSDRNKFIAHSKLLPQKLADAQLSRRIPGGVLVVFKGTIGSARNRFLGIIKAEIHGGFSKERRNKALIMNYLASLLLTPQQKLYKIALYIEKQKGIKDYLPEHFSVYVYDHNLTKRETRQAAQYFYDSFLGCVYSPSDKFLTADFYYKTKDFINELDISEEDSLDLNTSLYAYLKLSHNEVVDINSFADQYLDEKIKDEYVEHMHSAGIPDRAFSKDLAYIKSKLRRRNLKFSSNVKISAPSAEFNELVNIIESKDGHTIVAIKGNVEKDY